MEALLAGGADVNARDNYARTALHVACSNRLHAVARTLLAHGADPNAQDTRGETALHLAAANHDAAAFAALLRLGADARVLNHRNETACASAAISRGLDCHTFRSLCEGSSPPLVTPSCDDTCGSIGAAALLPSSSSGWGGAPAASDAPRHTLSCPFEVVAAPSDLSPSRFISDFVSLQRPVIIKGLGHQTAAASLWTKRSLVRRWGSLNVTVSAVPHAQSHGHTHAIMPLETFVELHMNTSHSTGAYVFDSRVLEAQPELRSACPPPKLLRAARIVLSQFFIGAAATGSFPHFHGHALNTLVHGQKLWYFFPPNEAHFNVKSISRWLAEDWPAIAGQHLAAQRAGIAQCVQEAGDAVYVPQFWGHAVFNTAPSVGVAYEFDV